MKGCLFVLEVINVCVDKVYLIVHISLILQMMHTLSLMIFCGSVLGVCVFQCQPKMHTIIKLKPMTIDVAFHNENKQKYPLMEKTSGDNLDEKSGMESIKVAWCQTLASGSSQRGTETPRNKICVVSTCRQVPAKLIFCRMLQPSSQSSQTFLCHLISNLIL